MEVVKRIFKPIELPMLCILVILLGFSGYLQAEELTKVIDKNNCAKYKDIIIPAMYRAIERGDFFLTPGNINFKYKHDDKFLTASAKNKGKFDINKEGELIEKSTSKYPEYLYGMPFPNIDLKDSKVAEKIIYNFDFQRYRFMGSKDHISIKWIDKENEERYAAGIDSRLYMNGRPPGQEIKNNPDKVLAYEFQNISEPMPVRGTNTMAYTYMGPKDNSSYAYIPAIRRTRQTTSTSRSDPYMGSDSWIDANYMWSGKTPSMKWKYVGEKTILASFASQDILPVNELPDGSIKRVFPFTGTSIPMGYENPNWKGASWAPQNITYVPRKVWVIEQIPKDPYYNWGRHINYVDQESYIIWYKEVYERSGDFRTWATMIVHYSEDPKTGKNNTGDRDCSLYIDEKARHATSSNNSTHPESFIFLPEAKLSPKYFTKNNFLVLSK
ncbi:MAG: DUF1329 domain-containing protein [Pseudomonadota bacterium]